MTYVYDLHFLLLDFISAVATRRDTSLLGIIKLCSHEADDDVPFLIMEF